MHSRGAFIIRLLALACLLTAVGVLVTMAVVRTRHSEAANVVTAASTSATNPAGTTAEDPSATPSGAEIKSLVVVGDEYAKNAGWPTLVAGRLNLRLVNVAEASAGYRTAPPSCSRRPCKPFAGMVEEMAGNGTDIIIFEGGQADGAAFAEGDLVEAIAVARRVAPRAKVLVLPPFSNQTPWPRSLSDQASTMSAVAKANAAVYVDVQRLAGDPGTYRGRGVSDEASEAIAQAVVAAARD